MHIFQKAVTEISWVDIQEFCAAGATEGAYLDYKREFPTDLAKTICAMANTVGGVVLIGVDEDDHGRALMPITGIPAARGLSERVMNIVVDSIAPPVAVESAVCLSEDSSRCVVVVRVPQSQSTPHAIAANTKVYIRTGNRNKPEELADLDRVESLQHRRAKSERFRDWLFDRADARFVTLRDGRVPSFRRAEEPGFKAGQAQSALFTFAIGPIYPDAKIAASPPELVAMLRAIRVRENMGTGHEFPLPDGVHPRLVEDGIVVHSSGGRGLRTYHTHLNMHGLFFYKQSLLWVPERVDGDPAESPAIRGSEVISRSFQAVESGTKFLGKLGYQGPVQIRLRLENIAGQKMLVPSPQRGVPFEQSAYAVDSQVNATTIATVQELSVDAVPHVLAVCQRIGWAFDWQMDEASLRRLWETLRRG